MVHIFKGIFCPKKIWIWIFNFYHHSWWYFPKRVILSSIFWDKLTQISNGSGLSSKMVLSTIKFLSVWLSMGIHLSEISFAVKTTRLFLGFKYTLIKINFSNKIVSDYSSRRNPFCISVTVDLQPSDILVVLQENEIFTTWITTYSAGQNCPATYFSIIA